MHLARNLLVSARLAEGLAGENIGARLDLNPGDLSLNIYGKYREYQDNGTQGGTDHGDSSNPGTWARRAAINQTPRRGQKPITTTSSWSFGVRKLACALFGGSLLPPSSK